MTNTPQYPAIPTPGTDGESLQAATLAMQQTLQIMLGQLGDGGNSAVTQSDLTSSLNGVVTSIEGETGELTLNDSLTFFGKELGLSLANVSVQATPANPTGTSNTTTGVMMGLGASCNITPAYGGRLRVEFVFTVVGLGASPVFTLRWGTGTPPTNGAALSGTVLGSSRTITAVSGADVTGVLKGIVDGLTAGTNYWFDVAVKAQSGTQTITGVDFDGFEF